MGIVEYVVVGGIAISLLFSDELMKGIKGMFGSKNDNNVNPAPVTPVPQPPVPAPAPTPGDTSIVGIVAGWNQFKAQCDAAGLDDVVERLDEIFPMLIQVEKGK